MKIAFMKLSLIALTLTSFAQAQAAESKLYKLTSTVRTDCSDTFISSCQQTPEFKKIVFVKYVLGKIDEDSYGAQFKFYDKSGAEFDLVSRNQGLGSKDKVSAIKNPIVKLSLANDGSGTGRIALGNAKYLHITIMLSNSVDSVTLTHQAGQGYSGPSKIVEKHYSLQE